MESWASRVHSVKHLSARQAARLHFNSEYHLNMDEVEGEDDARAYFPCPYCYVEIELPFLCIHLQEEHCFDLKNAVCPLCAANLGKDALGHFTSHHSHSIKRRRNSQKSGFWSNCPTMIGKDSPELSSFLGSNSISARSNAHDSAPDPLLSPFLCNELLADPKADQEDQCYSDNASNIPNLTSIRPARFDELEEQDCEERRHRVAFAQELIISTIF